MDSAITGLKSWVTARLMIMVSNGSPADKISNVMACNIGVTLKPMDKLKLTADVWYAKLAEDDYTGEKDLGTEVDLNGHL